jgi:hypothetical protein
MKNVYLCIVFFIVLGLTPEMRASQPDLYEVNENSMKSQQYPSEVNVLSKRVNRLSNGRQLFPVERVNFFRMDRQMLKKTRVERSQPYSGKDKKTQ